MTRLTAFWSRFNQHHDNWLLFTAILGTIAAVTWYTGAAPTLIYGQDDFFLLENGWRALWGHRAPVDYSSSWGPIMFLIVGLGLKLTGASVNALGVGNAIFGFVLGVWGWRVSRGRLTPVCRVAVAIYIALVVCAPFPLGTRPWRSSHATLYNRYGYALLLIMLVECFARLREIRREHGTGPGGASTGVALALCLFLKPSFCLGAVPLVLASLVLWRPNWARIAGLVAGFAAAFSAVLAYLRFDLSGLIASIEAAALARAAALPPGVVHNQLVQHRFDLVFGALVVMAIVWAVPARSFERGRMLVMFALLFGLDLALSMTNAAQTYSMPLMALLVVLVANGVSERPEVTDGLRRAGHGLVLCALVFLYHLGLEAGGVVAAAVRKTNPSAARSPVRFTEPRLQPLVLYEIDDPYQKSNQGSAYTTYINDGVALLKAKAGPEDRVLGMDMQNPFPFAMGWRPPTGGMASAAYNFTFTSRIRPSDDAYLGDATVVMIPKRPASTPDIIQGLYETYLPAVKLRFMLSAESERWWLYRRR